MDISEAMSLWNKRLADDCIYRVASGCRHDFGKGQCNIIICPLLTQEADLVIEYTFRDRRSK